MSGRWERMQFKRNKVWVAVDADGRPKISGGRATIRYRKEDEREYRVNPENLAPLGNPQPQQSRPSPSPDRVGEQAPPKDAVVIYTDGASSGNPGPAGIGVVMRWGEHRRDISRFIGTATNNIAELEAIRVALEAVKNPGHPVVIYTDSSYAHGLLTLGWKAKKNTALVEKIRGRLARFSDVSIRKVRGHAGNEGNEKADALATAAIRNRTSNG